MIEFNCFVLEDIMEPGMYMAPTEPGVPGVKTFKTSQEAEAYLWRRDCLVAMGYHVVPLSIVDQSTNRGDFAHGTD